MEALTFIILLLILLGVFFGPVVPLTILGIGFLVFLVFMYEVING